MPADLKCYVALFFQHPDDSVAQKSSIITGTNILNGPLTG